MKKILETEHKTMVLQASYRDVLTSYEAFEKAKILTVINLLESDIEHTEKNEFYKSHHIEELRFPIDDFSVPSSQESVFEVIQKIHHALKTHHVVIHCLGGRGRTGLVLSCLYSHLTKQKDGQFSIEKIREKVPGAVETPEQESFVRSYCDRYALKSLSSVPHLSLSDELRNGKSEERTAFSFKFFFNNLFSRCF